MRTLFIAHALLLMSDPDAGGGIPAEPNPNTNDAGAAPAAEPTTGGAPAFPSFDGTDTVNHDFTEADEVFAARIEAERQEFARLRESTPTQELELHPCQGTSKLGVIIGSPDGVRCLQLADWRTERLPLRAGDHVQIVVLVGEGLKTWEFYQGQAARQANVKTVSLDPATAASILGAAAVPGLDPGAGSPPVDPLEQTQDVTKPPATVGGDQAGQSGIGAGA
jgi:hypothetical protein